MTKSREKSIAIELRNDGLSYNEIYDSLHSEGMRVSKGSLSNWLREVDLQPDQVEEIKSKGIEKAQDAMRSARDEDKDTLTTGFTA